MILLLSKWAKQQNYCLYMAVSEKEAQLVLRLRDMRAIERSDYCCQGTKLQFFSYPTGLPQQILRSQDSTIRVSFGVQVAKTPTYMCPFRLFVALCDHNPPTLQMDRQTYGRTDGRRARSINATCIAV